MNKQALRKTMLSLEADALLSARETYLEYLMRAQLDPSEPIREDEHAQAETARDLAEAFDDAANDHAAKIAKLARIDFGPKSSIEEGAVVKLGKRQFVVAVSTAMFSCEGKEIIGISTMSPIYAELEGRRAGDRFTFHGRDFTVEEVA